MGLPSSPPHIENVVRVLCKSVKDLTCIFLVVTPVQKRQVNTRMEEVHSQGVGQRTWCATLQDPPPRVDLNTLSPRPVEILWRLHYVGRLDYILGDADQLGLQSLSLPWRWMAGLCYNCLSCLWLSR